MTSSALPRVDLWTVVDKRVEFLTLTTLNVVGLICWCGDPGVMVDAMEVNGAVEEMVVGS